MNIEVYRLKSEALDLSIEVYQQNEALDVNIEVLSAKNQRLDLNIEVYRQQMKPWM